MYLAMEDGMRPTPKNFVKYDDDKLRWSLLPRDTLRDVLRVLEYGAQKYAVGNWKKAGDEPDGIQRYWDAFDRHRDALQIDNELYDPETHLSHLSHMICNLMFIHWLTHYHPDIPEAPRS